jgi:cysteine desulfurase/selenocysteine lyase
MGCPSVSHRRWVVAGPFASEPLTHGSPACGNTACVGDWAADFGPFDGRVWLNAAHQGPLPKVGARAAEQQLANKVAPWRIDDDSFVAVPRRLRELLARLIETSAEQVILGNSASYGLQVLANGLRWSRGDEVLVLADEFPATVFPWLVAERRHGAVVRRLRLDGYVLTADRLQQELRPQTRVVCLNWVRSLTGHVVDLRQLGDVCRQRDVHLVVNATQGLGALPLSVEQLGLAAISCSGFKWLCGPYATGFAWVRRDLLEQLEPVQAYWLALPDGVSLDLNLEGELQLRDDLGARAYDVFGTANFLNFVPWSAALEYMLSAGLEAIVDHDQALTQQLIDGLDELGFGFISPIKADERAAIVVVSSDAGALLHEELRQHGVDVALHAGKLRFSPHLYNTPADIERALEVLGRSLAALPV